MCAWRPASHRLAIRLASNPSPLPSHTTTTIRLPSFVSSHPFLLLTLSHTHACSRPPQSPPAAQDSILECCDSEGLKEAAQQLIARVKPLPIDDTVVRGLLAELRVEEEPKAADAGVRLLKLLTRFMPSCIGKGSQALLVKEVTRLGRSGSSGPLGEFVQCPVDALDALLVCSHTHHHCF